MERHFADRREQRIPWDRKPVVVHGFDPSPRAGDSSEVMFAFIHIPKTGGASIRKLIPAANYGHQPLKSLIKVMGPKRSHDFIFTIVRNPWERLHSWYRHERWYTKMSFEDYVLGPCLSETFMHGVRATGLNVYDQRQWIECDGVTLDFIGRFERLRESIDEMFTMLGKPQPALPHLHDAHSRRVYPYSPELWTLPMLARVAEFFEPFAEEYGYNDLGGASAPE